MGDDQDRDRVLAVVARNVVAARERAGLTQETLALESQVTRRMVQMIEKGERNPSVVVLARIANALHVPVTDLVAGLP